MPAPPCQAAIYGRGGETPPRSLGRVPEGTSRTRELCRHEVPPRSTGRILDGHPQQGKRKGPSASLRGLAERPSARGTVVSAYAHTFGVLPRRNGINCGTVQT